MKKYIIDIIIPNPDDKAINNIIEKTIMIFDDINFTKEEVKEGFRYSGGNDESVISVEYHNEYKVLYVLLFTDGAKQYKKFPFNCPYCNNQSIVNQVSYDNSFSKWKKYLKGKVDFKPASYERIGMRCPNRKCSNCGATWFDSRMES